MSRLERGEIWVTLLRLISASTWLYAGVIGKLLNPGFLDPGSTDYVGLMIQYFAQGALIKGFLYAVVFPHPKLVGELVMIGEIIFGAFLLVGLLTKLIATGSFFTNLIYFLSAAWVGAVDYGTNLMMMFADIYLMLNGADNLSIDHFLKKRIKIINSNWWIVVGSLIYAAVILYLLIR